MQIGKAFRLPMCLFNRKLGFSFCGNHAMNFKQPLFHHIILEYVSNKIYCNEKDIYDELDRA